MSLLCSITGQVATQPVLNPANGRVYEKRMIEQHLLTSSTDPITNEPLSLSSLITISPASLALPPFLSSASPATLSLSSLLSTLQREYDGMMLEHFQLRRENFTLKQELASALYQYDAACRVIARVIRERDEAKAALVTAAAGTGAERAAAAGGAQEKEEKQAAMEVEGERKAATADEAEAKKALPAEVTVVFEETSKRLGAKNRKAWVKQRAAAAVSREEVKQYSLTAAFALHSASITGVNAVDIDESASSGGRLLLTGGQDGSVSLFDAAAGRLTESIRGHKKRVTDVAFFRPAQPAASQQTAAERLPLLSASADQAVHFYTFDAEQQRYTTSMVYSSHAAVVTSVSVHPSGLYFASAAADGCYCLHWLSSTTPLVSVTTPSPVLSLSFHPDGRILATTHADRAVRVYDVLQSQCVASLTSHAAAATTVAFSPNGYQCATGDEQGVVHLWDLRRVGNEKQADLARLQAGDAAVSRLCYDDSGGLLVGGVGATVAVWESGKELSELSRLEGHSAEVRAVKVGQGGSWIVSASKDRTVKLWGKRQPEQQAASSTTEMTG